MKNMVKWALLVLLVVMGNRLCLAQSTNSGDIRGTVTDSTGALVPGVKVTLLNVDTGVTKDFVTNQDGIYDTSSIVAGSYRLTFEKNGFGQYIRGPITVQVGVTTVDASLAIGSSQQSITVTTDVPLLQTETGEQSSTINSEKLAQLPQIGQDWQNMTMQIAGAAGATSSPQGSADAGQLVAVNGNLPYSNLLIDGASNTAPSSANASTLNQENIQELQVTTSSFSAQYGVGGVIFNQISKGGTSSFHGVAYDYLQNNDLNAFAYGFGSPQLASPLHFNNFGGSIGGPVMIPVANLKKKAFFYFNYDQIVKHGSPAAPSTQTVPTTDVIGGSFAGMQTIYDPTTETWATDSTGAKYPVRKSFASEYGSNAIPSAMFDKVASAFQKYWPTPASHPSFGQFVPGSLTGGVVKNNWKTAISSSNPNVNYFGRADYDITANNRITLSWFNGHGVSVAPGSLTACPLGCQNQDSDGNMAQISDVWNISTNTINEARMGYTTQFVYYSDPALNKGYAAALGWQFAKADDAPIVTFANYAQLGPNSNSAYKQHVFDPSDVVTTIKGKHILHFGGELLVYQDNSTAWGNSNAGTMNFSGQYTQQWVVDPGTGIAHPNTSSGMDYADYLLGQVQSWNANVTPEFGGRFKSPQIFAQDDYKLRPNLTVNLGIRYQINHGWNDVKGNFTSFDPTVMNPVTNTLGAAWFGTTHANGRTALMADVYTFLMPRVGFSWSPIRNTTFRGGFGLYGYTWSLDQYATRYGNGIGSLLGASGSVSDLTNGQTPVVILASSGSNLPYSNGGTNPARFNGQGIGYYPYHTPIPKIYQWNLSVQHQFTNQIMAEIGYVASHGFDLVFPTSLSQVPQSQLGPNDASLRPYSQYNYVAGSTNNAISNYNSLQTGITQRLSHGLTYSFSYVWSHFLDEADSSGWGGRGGTQEVQNAYDPLKNYGNSNFDLRHAFKGNAAYKLPFGKGALFLNHNALADEIVGGWQLTGTVLRTSGQPFSVTVDQQDNSYSLSGPAGATQYHQYPNRNTAVSMTPANRSINNWFNTSAFTLPQAGTFGNTQRNSLDGPSLTLFNLSCGKTFSIWENMKFAIRADTTNAFNHANFGVPSGTSLTGSAGPGQPFTGTTPISSPEGGGRQIQFVGRLTF